MAKRIKAASAPVDEPLAPGLMPPKLNWAVMWLRRGKRGWEIFEHWCGDDFAEALRIYELARGAGKRGATLRCANYAFAPPEKYREHYEARWKVVTRKGKRYKKRVKVLVNPMKDLNARGIFWCPYCIKLRRFEKHSGFMLEGIYVPRVAHYCPMCGISHELTQFRIFNPSAYKLDPPKRIRRSKSNGRAKKTRRRRG